MPNPKQKTEEAPEWLKLIVKWIFLIVGVPGLAYIFLFTSVQYTFESATTGWQIKMKCKISSFLTERQDRFKPAEANNLELKRLHKIDFSGNIHIVEKPTNTNMILVKSGDLVISGINVEKGAVSVYQGDEDLLATIHYSSYEFDKEKIDINYFKWFLKSEAFKKAILAQTKGGIKTELKPKKFLPLEIDLPDIKVQKEILKRIQSIESEIKQLEGKSQKDQIYLEKLKQAILSEAIQGKLVPQNPKDESAEILLKKIKVEKEKLIKEKKIKKEKPLSEIAKEEIPYELPKGWAWCRLGEITKIIAGNSFKSQDFNNEGGVKVIKITNCGVRKFIETEDYLPLNFIKKYENFSIQEGDFVISLTRPFISSGLKICICPEKYNNSLLNQRVAAIKNLYSLSQRYLFYFLASSQVLMKFKSRFNNTVSHPNLKMDDLNLLEVPLPPLAEQKRIVEKVDKLMKLCDELENKINKNKIHSEKLMDAILREVFENGK